VEKEDKTGRTLDYIMGNLVPAYLGFIITAFVFLTLFGCHSEPPKPKEIHLSVFSGDTDEERCPYSGDIVSIGNVVGSDEVLGGSGLIMVLVRPDKPDVPGMYVAAVAHKSDNFSVGDRVDVCQTKILVRQRAGGEYEKLFITRKRPGISYADSGAERLKSCQEDLEQCNESLVGVYDACTKHLQETK